MRKFVRSCAGLLSATIIAVMGFVAFYEYSLPNKFYSYDGSIYVNSLLELNVDESGAMSASNTINNIKRTQLKLFGVIPVKQIEVETVEQKLLVPCGNPFGIKLNTDGVLVIGTGEIKTENGVRCPAKEAQICEGDAIVSINGKTVFTNEDIEDIVSSSSDALSVTIRRDNKEKTVKLCPCVDTSGIRRVGLWVRDSSAGIGTVTYYDPQTSEFGGLGHPICDVDTGEIMPLLTGEVVKVEINDIVKGVEGDPGELKGNFVSHFSSGIVSANDETGVYGKLYKNPSNNKALPIGLRQEVKAGKATIYTTIEGSTPKEYSIEIEKISISDNYKTKNMIIKVTDVELLAKTGGIVQGMSGSPIIQDGKIVGAVTHVLVNDPTKGYGIFIENMLDACE